jgi:predicted metal-dependent hydrolase
MNDFEDTPLVVAFVADLMFTSKIKNVVSGLGYDIRWVGRAQDISALASDPGEGPGERLHGQQGELFEKITAWQPVLLLFDLANEDIPWAQWIPALKSSPATRRIPLIAYGSHVNVEMMKGAKEAGADLVLARSRFTADMPRLLQTHARIPDRQAIDSACAEPLSALALSGIEKFNQGAYYPSHDDLEEAWRQDTGAARDLYRSILQVGISYYQIEKGNYRGAVKMLLRARQWLEPLPDVCRGVDVRQLREDATAVYDALTALGPEQIAEFDHTMFRPVHFKTT